MKGQTYIKQIDGEWYAFEGDSDANEVRSIGRDNPPAHTDCDRYWAKWSDAGIKSVASPSKTRRAAYSKAKRAVTDEVTYGGEI